MCHGLAFAQYRLSLNPRRRIVAIEHDAIRRSVIEDILADEGDEVVLRHIPVVIVSADPSPEKRDLAVTAEHRVWTVAKPFDVAELVEVVGRAATLAVSPRRRLETMTS